MLAAASLCSFSCRARARALALASVAARSSASRAEFASASVCFLQYRTDFARRRKTTANAPQKRTTRKPCVKKGWGGGGGGGRKYELPAKVRQQVHLIHERRTQLKASTHFPGSVPLQLSRRCSRKPMIHPEKKGEAK